MKQYYYVTNGRSAVEAQLWVPPKCLQGFPNGDF